ncbi:MAG: hypothetical protein AB1746_12720, partial [Candidatus Zixiibacteriota bacterium]
MIMTKGSKEWVYWEDLLSKELGQYLDWTTIAELNDASFPENWQYVEKRATLSFITENSTESCSKFFKNDSWDIHFEVSSINISDYSDKLSAEINSAPLGIEYIITKVESLGKYPQEWRLWFPLMDYFRLFRNTGGNYVDPQNDDVVIRMPPKFSEGPIQIRTDYLQDYLAARDMILIRQHDHRRHWSKPIKHIEDHADTGIILTKKWGIYRINFNNYIDYGYPFSRLMAKDFIPPAKKAGRIGIHRNRHHNVDYDEIPSFIIDREQDGSLIKEKPNADKLEPIIFFQPMVLKKYYDEPSKYTVGFSSPGFGGVGQKDFWSIAIGRNEEGLINLWLGDLVKQRLPIEEIRHWHSYNIPPRGHIAKDFWDTQMENNPSSVPSLETRLVDLRYNILKEISNKGYSLFKEYAGPDNYLEHQLRIPLNNEHIEMKICVETLSKIFIEYIDFKSLKRDLGADKEEDNDADKKPLVIFADWLTKILKTSQKCANSLKVSLQHIQKVRSKCGFAHKYSESAYLQVLKEIDIDIKAS